MTLDEAIKMCEYVFTFSSEEYEQLAEWLEELKLLRELKDEHRKIGNIEGFNKGYSKAENDYYAQSEKDRQSSYDCGYWIGYKMAIDDFAENIRIYYALKQEMGYVATTYEDLINYIFELAEQLKAGGENEQG